MDINGINTESKKLARFNEIEKVIRSSEIEKLSIDHLREYQKELSLNIASIEERTYLPKWQCLNSIILSKINEITTKEDKITASKRFCFQIILGIITLIFVILGLYLTHCRQSNVSEAPIQKSPQSK